MLDTGRPAVIEIDECGALGEVFLARSGAKNVVLQYSNKMERLVSRFEQKTL